MKKRFTVMLEQRVIDKLKQLNGYWKPSAVRENIEAELEAWADYHLDQLVSKEFSDTISRYQFDDK